MRLNILICMIRFCLEFRYFCLLFSITFDTLALYYVVDSCIQEYHENRVDGWCRMNTKYA